MIGLSAGAGATEKEEVSESGSVSEDSEGKATTDRLPTKDNPNGLDLGCCVPCLFVCLLGCVLG